MFGSAPKCKRCNKSVYKAEEVLGAGSKWHRQCFNCAYCHTGLDSTTLNEREGEIFCKACYGKNFAPTGYGYGQGAGALKNTGKSANQPVVSSNSGAAKFCGSCGANVQGVKFCPQCGSKNESSVAPAASSFQSKAANFNAPAAKPAPKPRAKPAFGAPKMNFNNNPQCGRCGKSVYFAEKAMGAGKAWHKKCFRCKDCGKGLDSTTLKDNEGEIYCSGCYGKNFGPKGFGYGQGAGALHNTGK